MLRFLGMLCIVETVQMAGLKLNGFDLSWWLVLAPVWFPIFGYVVFAAVLLALFALAMGHYARRA